MNFSTAIRKLNTHGGFINRPDIPSSYFLQLTHGGWLIYMNGGEDDLPQLFVEDYLANDWKWYKGWL